MPATQSATPAIEVEQPITKQVDKEGNKLPMKTKKQAIDVMIVDTHTLMLMALRRVLATFPQVRMVMHLQTTDEVSTFIERTSVDVIVFGVSISVSECLQFTHAVRKNHSHLGIVMIQPHLHQETAFTLVKEGVHGLLDEFASEQDLADAISAVATGNTFLSKHAHETIASSTSCAAPYLTARELEVVSLLMRGTSNFRIAQALGLKEKTIETYLTHIYNKLGVTSRVEAIICLQGLQV